MSFFIWILASFSRVFKLFGIRFDKENFKKTSASNKNQEMHTAQEATFEVDSSHNIHMSTLEKSIEKEKNTTDFKNTEVNLEFSLKEEANPILNNSSLLDKKYKENNAILRKESKKKKNIRSDHGPEAVHRLPTNRHH